MYTFVIEIWFSCVEFDDDVTSSPTTTRRPTSDNRKTTIKDYRTTSMKDYKTTHTKGTKKYKESNGRTFKW